MIQSLNAGTYHESTVLMLVPREFDFCARCSRRVSIVCKLYAVMDAMSSHFVTLDAHLFPTWLSPTWID